MKSLFDESAGSIERGLLSATRSPGQGERVAVSARGAQTATPPRRGLLALAGLSGAILILTLSALSGHLPWLSANDTAAGASSAASPADVSAIAAKVDPGLVDVNTNLTYYEGAKGAGTGIVLTPNGEVLTNNHVVAGATRVSVTDIGNGKTYSAAVVGYDPSKDVAVLQLKDASGLQTASIGNSASAAVGESIIGIGNAGGAGGTPSAAPGAITALHQSISAGDQLTNLSEQLSGLIEINADVQPGDSGGSLVNTAGQVIGMDTAGAASGGYFSFQAGAASQAYAIPIDTALAVAAQIEAGRASTSIHVGATAFLGLGVVPTASASSGYPGFGYNGYAPTATVAGLEVSDVISGLPAAKAGLVPGDVLTSFDAHRVTTDAELTDRLLVLRPGATVTIGWAGASGRDHSATVTLASGPAA